jgi:adenylate cyclase
MTTEGMNRKLAAILSADVKEYSRLMSQDERGTIRTLTAYKEAMSSIIREYKGRVVDAPGDNLLAEFGSVVDSVNCAVEIQRELAQRKAELPDARKMEFRIGINLGDIVEEKGRIYGDGVNIAARVESLAEGGGICISGTAFDQVKNKLGFEYEHLGEREVKNIQEPVRVYRVRTDGRATESVNVTGRPADLELLDKPSIAVLPFVNMSGDPEQEYFSDGLSEEIITALSKIPDLFVIARNSTFIYKGKAVNVQQVGRELGVQYVLEGSVRKAGDRIRVTAQLIDSTSGGHLWAERYDRKIEDIFAVQDNIVMNILKGMPENVIEKFNSIERGTDNLEAYLKVLQGVFYIKRLTEENNMLARTLYEDAVALDPQYATAYAMLGWTHLQDVSLGWSESPAESLQEAEALASKCLDLDPSSLAAQLLLGRIYMRTGQFEKAIAAGKRAVSLDPTGALTLANYANTLLYTDRPNEAIEFLQKARRLDPFEQTTNYSLLFGVGYRMTGRYEEAVEEWMKAVQRDPNAWPTHLCLAIGYTLLGRAAEAHFEVEEVLRINPDFSVEYWDKTTFYKNQADKDLIIEAIRKAGIPEKSSAPTDQ